MPPVVASRFWAPALAVSPADDTSLRASNPSPPSISEYKTPEVGVLYS